MAEDFPRLIDATETMKDTRLSPDEQRVLAEASLVARYGEVESPVRSDQIIAPRRREDVGQSLWSKRSSEHEIACMARRYFIGILVPLRIFPGISLKLSSDPRRDACGRLCGAGDDPENPGPSGPGEDHHGMLWVP